MPLNIARSRALLAKADLRGLFIEELGWDRHTGRLQVDVEGTSIALEPIAHKRGMIAYQCSYSVGGRIPAYPTRRKIERQVARSAHEHLIVFVDAADGAQVWQWVKRESGRPAACREHWFTPGQSGDGLLQKLASIAFSLDEETDLSLTEVTRRARSAFDVERITKRFFDRFQKEHAAFLQFISGIAEAADREWYASVMLNRLMFVYFVQRKGFLDGDRDYLRNRLARMRAAHGSDKFFSFYRYFLLRLFHEGLGGKNRGRELEELIGRIPYLNGGLFDVHELESPTRYGPTIAIPDEAFERIFDYFDQYQWHLDERPLRDDNEINPDVLGYIFEKYINQKQMGAYYTKEDITEYIGKTSIIPKLFDNAATKYGADFNDALSARIASLLRTSPDRYIYPSARHGLELPLPQDIAAGIAPPSRNALVTSGPVATLDLRQEWNRPALASHGLPTETWREVVARRDALSETRDLMLAGRIRSIDELTTQNLDVIQITIDLIEGCEDPKFLGALWSSLTQLTILDPTCGSGAFLFAALNLLEPLYESCLERMEAFVRDAEHAPASALKASGGHFHATLGEIDRHPNRRYFVLKSIILNNLFGVDIMEEAVEICKLRLFLKLAAQVEPDERHENFGVEPLPDIDFNIRSGNALVGFSTMDSVRRSVEGSLDFDSSAERISTKAADLQEAMNRFRASQTAVGVVPASEGKKVLKELHAVLREELDQRLAADCGIAIKNHAALAAWHKAHRPFHWCVEFYHIVEECGGFDVVIGNPPYVEYSHSTFPYKIDQAAYRTFAARNLYAYVYERSKDLTRLGGRIGMIVQISSVSTPTMAPMAAEVRRRSRVTWVSNFATRPSCLFDGVTMNLTILLSLVGEPEAGGAGQVFTTRYLRWSAEFREHLFSTIRYVPFTGAQLFEFSVPKLTRADENTLLDRLASQKQRLSDFLSPSNRRTNQEIFYRTAGGRYFKVFSDRDFGSESKSNKSKFFAQDVDRFVMIAVLSSNLWWWYYTLHFDMYNCKDYMMFGFPLDYRELKHRPALAKLGSQLVDDLFANAERKIQSYESTGKRAQLIFKPSSSKAIIDRIDLLLANHFGLTEDDLDFIVNYDIKYRVGADASGDED